MTATHVFDAKPDPLAYLRLNPDDSVTLIAKHMEMGQGIYTGLATLVAEELDARREQLRIEAAPIGPAYGNALMGGIQGTGGQTSIQSSYLAMRMAGAALRQMLITAAAQRWQLDPARLRVQAGRVMADGGSPSASFAELAAAAMAAPVPATVTLKNPAEFIYIGKAFARLDAEDKNRGRALFTQDLSLPGMLTAVIARPKRWGETLKSFDASKALATPGVRHVLQVAAGVAVVADDFWSALQGREQLLLEWDASQAFRMSSAEIQAELAALTQQPGAVAAEDGDVEAGLAAAATRLDRTFHIPFHAHAPMETLNIIAQLSDGVLQAWGGMQMVTLDQYAFAQAAGVAPEQVRFHMQMTGGSFGRRSTPGSAICAEVVSIIRGLGTELPIKLMYDRPDDMAGPQNYYRPAFVHRIEAGLDAQGRLIAWRHRAAGQSILIGTPMESAMVQNGIDGLSVEGARDQAYRIPNRRMELHSPVYPVLPSLLRSSGVFHNAFAIETMLDELARQADRDPADFRLDLLPEDARERACLLQVMERAGWRMPLAPAAQPGARRGRGLALAPAHRSYAAMVVEVTVAADARSYTVDRVVVVLDCGLVINPDNVISQLQGSVAFGLSMARYGEISLSDGVVEQNFFSDYHITRMHTMPAVEASFLDSEEGPSGASETAVSVVAPALANALLMATGEPQRRIPLRLPGEPVEHWDVPAGLNTFAGAQTWVPAPAWRPISAR